MPLPSSTNPFDQSARDWDKRRMSVQLAEVSDLLLPLLQLNASQHWLDFGSGTGLLSLPLAKKVEWVTALDTSEKMLEVLAEKGIANVQPLNQNVFSGLPHDYDVVISCMALHHVDATDVLLQKFYCHLKKDGQLALVDLYAEDGSFHGDNKGKGVKHLGFDIEVLRGVAEKVGFVEVSFSEIMQIQHRNGSAYPLFVMLARRR